MREPMTDRDASLATDGGIETDGSDHTTTERDRLADPVDTMQTLQREIQALDTVASAEVSTSVHDRAATLHVEFVPGDASTFAFREALEAHPASIYMAHVTDGQLSVTIVPGSGSDA